MTTSTRRAPFRAALAALGLGAVLAAGLVAPTATAADAAVPTAGLLADYRFSQTTGATVLVP